MEDPRGHEDKAFSGAVDTDSACYLGDDSLIILHLIRYSSVDHLTIPMSECAVSSVVEHILHTDGVTGSNPVPRTISFVQAKPEVDSDFSHASHEGIFRGVGEPLFTSSHTVVFLLTNS